MLMSIFHKNLEYLVNSIGMEMNSHFNSNLKRMGIKNNDDFNEIDLILSNMNLIREIL